jgi:hypothetical protein
MKTHGIDAAAARQGFVDLDLCCVSCGVVFTWFAGEQLFFQEKNLRAPRRCKPCRTRQSVAPLAERRTG